MRGQRIVEISDQLKKEYNDNLVRQNDLIEHIVGQTDIFRRLKNSNNQFTSDEFEERLKKDEYISIKKTYKY